MQPIANTIAALSCLSVTGLGVFLCWKVRHYVSPALSGCLGMGCAMLSLSNANQHLAYALNAHWVAPAAGWCAVFSVSGVVILAAVHPQVESAIATTAQRASLDPLTQLHNRQSIEHKLASIASDSARGAAILFLDIDNFKSVNDTYGHDAGDRVLRQVAEVIRHNMRSSDLVERCNNTGGRWAGDEFIAVLIGCPYDSALEIANRIKVGVQQVRISSRTMSASIGVTMLEPGDSPASALKRADTAMYTAKNLGKGRVSGLAASAQS